jgi:hypothetical protein
MAWTHGGDRFFGIQGRINATEVAPELLGEVMVMISALAPAEREAFEVRAMRVVDLVKSEPARSPGALQRPSTAGHPNDE